MAKKKEVKEVKKVSKKAKVTRVFTGNVQVTAKYTYEVQGLEVETSAKGEPKPKEVLLAMVNSAWGDLLHTEEGSIEAVNDCSELVEDDDGEAA